MALTWVVILAIAECGFVERDCKWFRNVLSRDVVQELHSDFVSVRSHFHRDVSWEVIKNLPVFSQPHPGSVFIAIVSHAVLCFLEVDNKRRHF